MLRKRFSVVRVLEACLFSALACSCNAASGSDRSIAQFAHTTWGPKDGAPSPVTALAQTSDGYLWVGGTTGLYRFDGVTFERYEPQSGGRLPVDSVTALLALPNGDLWIAYTPGEISLLRSGNAKNYTTHDGLPSQWIMSLSQDREGAIWAATGSGLMRFEGERWRQVGRDWNFEGKVARALFVDRQGALWVDTDGTLLQLPLGARRFQPTGIAVGFVPQIAQAPDGKLWMAESTRSVRPIPLFDKRKPNDDAEIQVGSQAVLFDGEGALWVTTLGNGIVRCQAPEVLKGINGISSSSVESFTAKDGLSDDIVRSILQDREGNIWVGTNGGLDRFRKTNLVPVILPLKTFNAVAAPGSEGDVWVAKPESMVRVHGGRAEHAPLLPSGALSAYRDSSGAIWWICADAIFRYNAGSYTKIPLPWLPKPDAPRDVVATSDNSGTLWLSADREGVFYRKDGVWHRLPIVPAVADLTPRTAYTDWMGRAWFGFVGGTILVVNKDNSQRVFSAGESLAGSVSGINGRGRHVWVVGQSGLAFFDGEHFRQIAPADAETFGSALAVEETSDGDLWLAEDLRVIKIAAAEIHQVLGDPFYRVKYRSFDSSDGLSNTLAGPSPLSHETLGTDGRLWFLTSTGIEWIDPAHISTNSILPPVSIRLIKANGKVSQSLTNMVLPPRTTNLQISYTALSLTVPEKVRFRYRLEGVDKEWQDAGNRREAFYNRLGPGEYHFHVIACNNDGVWNNAGSTLNFRIAPAWFQTIWFRTFYGFVFLSLLWLLYQLRVKQLQQQFAIGLEARVNERTRIARELHDTLLQDFHGLMFQFQAVHNLMGRRPEEAKQSLGEAIADTKKALAESRDAIQGLRLEPIGWGDLAALLKTASQELAHSGGEDPESPKFDLIEEGERRNLSQTIREDVCRVALEILRNAYQHAQAHHVEAEIRYGVETFRLRIRDDGRGVDPEVLKEGGRPGHWGLRGIRERAERMGAHVDFWSESGAGTEVQIEVPGSLAYERSPDRVWPRLLRKVRNHARRS
jgi:signal transduction histidine kinase/ligand-binding sensor domain-containing protein